MVKYKSKEECNFASWLGEAQRQGLVEKWGYEPCTFELIPKQIHPDTKKFAFHPMTYTPDFVVVLTEKGRVAFPQWAKWENEEHESWMDVKGTYDPFRKDDRFLQANRKLMYWLKDIYVLKITIGKAWWKETWLPESMRLTEKTKKPTALSTMCLTCEQFCARIKGIQQDLL